MSDVTSINQSIGRKRGICMKRAIFLKYAPGLVKSDTVLFRQGRNGSPPLWHLFEKIYVAQPQ